MKPDFLFALYVFCADYHSGQWSRLYRLSCRLASQYRVRLSDNAWREIRDGGDEWYEAHEFYNELVARYANDKR